MLIYPDASSTDFPMKYWDVQYMFSEKTTSQLINGPQIDEKKGGYVVDTIPINQQQQ